jgi:zinc protease
MQKMLRTIWALCFMMLAYTAIAQDMPLDPQVRTGKLSNGLTYYIRKNAKPEKRVELRLAINAGSLMEDEDQLGLAHFTEHMCFNGTKNFPKNELVNFLQTSGVRFGADLNAYTSFDETVYMLPLPTDKEELIDKGLQILEDWAHNVSFEGTEIDKERGVVVEEWRTGRGADQRMLDKWLPVLFKNSRYAERLPIGKKETLENFKHETIRKFYKDWYRPDLMAVIVVGDIDVDKMEAKIKTYFGRIEASKTPRERKKYDVPAHKETYVKVLSDKESAFNSIQVYYKQPNEVMRNQADYRNSLLYELYQSMLGERLDEISKTPETPYIFAYSGYGNVVGRGAKAYQIYTQAGDENIEKALIKVLTENKRVLDYGFNPSELERAKQDLMKGYEKRYNERAKTNSDRYVDEYIRLFLEGEPAPGIEFEYDLVKKLLPSIKVEEINALPKKWITIEYRVAIITAADKPSVKLPTEERVLEIINQIDNIKVDKYEDKVITEPLMATMPTAGKIVKEVKLPKIEDVTELTLSNGARVVYKKTNFKDDEIRITASSQGGSSLYSESDMYSAAYSSEIINEGGVGKFSDSDLKKMMSGKNVRINTYVGENEEGVFGSTTPKDVETAFQLLHLRFTAPRKDESNFKAFKTKNQALFKNLASNPMFFFFIEVGKIMSNGHPRYMGFPKPEDLDKINLDRAHEIYKERFGNAKDFVFTIVGNFDEATLKPLIEKYIASLPSNMTAKPEKFKDLGVRPPKGFTNKEIKKGQDPKSQVSLVYTGELKSAKDEFAIRAFGDVLENKLIENLREDKGGVYSPQAGAGVSRVPYLKYSVNVGFSCAPENVEKLVNAVNEEITKLKNNGPTPEDLQKVKEAYRREFEKNSKENEFWVNRIQRIYEEGAKPTTLAESQKRIEALTAKEIQAAAKKYTMKENLISIALYPEKVVTEGKSTEEKKEESSAENNTPVVADKNMTAEKVIEKYIEAIGGRAKLEKVTSLRTINTSEVMGMSIETEVSKKGTDKMLMVQKMMGQEGKTVVNGNKGSSKGGPMGDQELDENMVKTLNQPFFPELDYIKNGVKMELLPAETVEGKTAYPVKIKVATIETTVWYDVKTGLVIKSKNPQMETIVNSYTEVAGITFPEKTTIKVQGMEMKGTSKVEVNPTLSDDLFKVE